MDVPECVPLGPDALAPALKPPPEATQSPGLLVGVVSPLLLGVLIWAGLVLLSGPGYCCRAPSGPAAVAVAR